MGATEKQLQNSDFLTNQYYRVGDKLALFDNAVGPNPTRDGELNAYAYDPAAVKGQSSDVPRVIYVNGIQTAPEQHRQSALYLSWITKRWVTGVYVKKSSTTAEEAAAKLVRDPNTPPDVKTFLQQHIKAKDLPAGAGSFLGDIAFCLKEHDAELGPNNAEYAKGLLWQDPPALAIYQLITERFLGKQVHIVPHSRGNLTVSLALWAIGLTYGPAPLVQINVYALASPAPRWPDGIYRRNYNNYDDPITWVSSPDLTKVLAKLPIGQIADKIMSKQPLTEAEYYNLCQAMPDLKALKEMTSYKPGRRMAESPSNKSGGFYDPARPLKDAVYSGRRPTGGVGGYIDIDPNDLAKIFYNHCVLLYMADSRFENDIRGRIGN